VLEPPENLVVRVYKESLFLGVVTSKVTQSPGPGRIMVIAYT
jgi:hypothetical protein